jgi:hypothetical protein
MKDEKNITAGQHVRIFYLILLGMCQLFVKITQIGIGLYFY